MATAKERFEKRRRERESNLVANAMSEDNLLSASGRFYERQNKNTYGYTNLSDVWKKLYKRANDYYNNEAYKGYADAYNGMVGNEGYVGKNDAGRWYRDLEKQKNTANEGVDELLAELDKYSRYYNEDAVKYVRDLITQRQKSYDDVLTEAKKFNDNWSQWETEDDYNKAVWYDKYSKMSDEELAAAREDFNERAYAKNSEIPGYQALDEIDNAITVLGDVGVKAFNKTFGTNLENKPRSALGGYVPEEMRSEKEILDYIIDRRKYEADNADYLAVQGNEDFADKSKYVSTKTGDREVDWLATIGNALANAVLDTQQGAETVYKGGQGYEDIVYDIINGNPEAKRYLDEQNMNAWGGLAAGLGLTSTEYLTQLEEEEKGIFNYLYATEGKERAYEYLSHLEDKYLNARARKELETQMSSFAAEAPVLSSLLTVGSAPARGLAWFSQFADLIDDGEIQKDARYNQLLYSTNAIRNQVSHDIEASGKWGEVGSFAYGVGMSMGDFLTSTVAGFGNPTATGLIMATSAAADTTMQGIDRGLDSTRAFITGAIAGAAEFVTEKMQVNRLFDLALLGKDKFTYVLKNALSEGAEEGITDIVNWAADDLYDLISGQSMSEWKMAIAAYEEQGYSTAEAFGKALGDRAVQLGSDVAAGMLSGGIMGGAGAGLQTISEYKEGGKYTSDPAVLIDEALKLDPNNEYALELKEKLESGEKISQAQLGKLSFGNIETVNETLKQNDKDIKAQNKETIENKLASKIKRTGNEELISSLAESITKAVRGEKVSNAELRRISQNKAALEVLRNALKANFDIKAGVSVSDLRNAITSKQSSSARLSTENILSRYSAFFNMDEAAERSLMVNYAADAKNAESGKAVNPEDYASVYGLVYAAGKKGADLSTISRDASKILSQSSMMQAYRAGENAASVNAQEDLQSGENSGIINKNAQEVQDEQGVYLREGGKRNRGTSPQGQVSAVEGYAGQDQSRRQGGARPRDDQAASLSYDRKEVNAQTLGIKGGLKTGSVRLVAEGSETESTKEAKRIADERGLNLVLFGGGNLEITSGGKNISARAYIEGKNVYVRVDHPDFTADQLMMHEAGHDMIAKGEVDVEDVRKLINERFTPEEIDAVSKSYEEAYRGTGLDANEIWEEVICDSLAGMNVFEGVKGYEASAEMAADFLPDLKKATLESRKEATGPPKNVEGKASIQEITGPSGTKYGIGVYLDSTLLTDLSENERVQMVKERIKELGGQGFTAFDSNNNEVKIHIVEYSQRFKNVNGRKVRVYDHMLGYLKNEIKQEAVVLADELISASSYNRSEPSSHPHDWLDNNGSNAWESWKTYIQDKENTVWEATLKIANSANGAKILYEVYPIKMVEQSGKPNTSTTNISIPQNSGLSTPNSKKVSKTDGHASIDLESMNTDYMSAVERGDMETAQRMVDEAAKEAGYDYHLYHGTNADFTKFDLRKYGGRNGKGEGYGIYLAANREISAPYGKNVIDSFVKFNRLAEGREKTLSYNEVKNIVKRSCELEAQRMVDDEGYDSISDALKDTWVSNTVYTYGYSNMQQVYADVANKLLKENDNDGDIINEVMALSGAHYDYNNALDFYENILTPATGIDGFHYIWGNKDGSGVQNDIYLALRSDQVKSADPVTYDNNGNVIPLSERFNSSEPDIRFSQDLFEDMDEVDTKGVEQELSDRERLAAMFESEDMSPSQKGMLTKYKNKLSDIEANEAKIAEMTEELDALKKKGKGNTSRAVVLESKISKLEKQNAVSEGIILNIEAAKPIKRLLERERKAAYQEGLLAGQMAQGKDTASKLRKTEEELATQKQKSKTDLAEYKRLAAQRESEALLAGQMAQGRKDAEILRKTEEELAATKQKSKDELAKLRQKRKDDLDALAKRYLESRAKSYEGRHQTKLRGDIARVVKELDTLLRKGNKERNVKLGLQGAVASALEAFNINEAKLERYAKDIASLNEKIEAASGLDQEALIALKEKQEAKQRNSELLSDKLAVMKKAYEDIHNNENGENYPSYYRAEAKIIMDRIGDVLSKVGDTPISKMTSSQLESVYDMYRMVLTTVRDANKAFINGKLEDLTENANDVTSELQKIKKLPEERLKAGDNARGFVWNELTPYYAFKRIGSDTLMRYYDELVRGQDVYARDLDEAKQFAEAMRKKYKLYKWDRNKITTFKDKDGKAFRLNLEQMMSIYAYSKREQALDHMEFGGFFFNNKETFRKDKTGLLEFVASNESGYKINAEILAKITSALTAQQRAYVDEMQAYLTDMGEKGNEVSRKMWGIDIFKEKVYFPLKSKNDFIYQANTPAETSSLKNDGMTKETKPHASNPIVLESFDEVWANHVNKMSMYHGFVIPIDNLNKIINYGSWIDGDAQSISTMLEARYSSAVNDYLTTFIKDLNGAKAQNGGLLGVMSNWLTKFKKTAVAASLSVVVQQPTAILRALSEIDAKYFAHSPKKETLNAKWSKIQKYAPVAILKDIGGFDAGSGKQMTEWLNADTRQGLEKAMNKVDDLTMYGAALGDRIGWGAIWAAVEREVQAKQKLQYGTEEFWQACGKRFTDIIVRTQVYDSTLSRSGFMRGKDGLLKMATAFMGEPTLSINMLADAILQGKRGTMKRGQVARTVAAVYTATVAAAIFKSFVYALRDDDEDESYAEKYLQAFGGSILNDINPLSMLPIFRDVVSILDGWEVERTDMAIVQDLYNAFTALSSENKTPWRKFEDLAGALGAVAGVPAKNLLRTMREMYNSVNDTFDGIFGGDLGGAFIEGITGKEKSKHQTLYEAMIGGEKERISVLRKGYKTEKDYMTAVRSALRKYDPRIKKAAQALLEGDLLTRNEIMLDILKEGIFDKETVDRAIDAEAQAIKDAESKDNVTEGEEDNGEYSVYSSNDINLAFNYGSDDLALEIIAELTQIKVAEKVEKARAEAERKGKYFDEQKAQEEAEYEVASSLRSVMTTYWKPLYQEAYASGNREEMGRIKDILKTSGLYKYKTDKTVDDVLEEWIESYEED